jgi:flavin reductase (DIM6/NTAB) family NADH-FMN oxidoreductase RutF
MTTDCISSLANVLDPRTLREAYACFPSGIVSICGLVGDEPVGLVASSFTAVSLDPPLVSFCIRNDSTTWPRLQPLPRLGLSVLGEAHDSACRQLSAMTGNRFAGLRTETTPEGAIFVAGAPAWIECSVRDELPAGDHRIVLLQIHALASQPAVAPLVFHGSSFASLRQLAS